MLARKSRFGCFRPSKPGVTTNASRANSATKCEYVSLKAIWGGQTYHPIARVRFPNEQWRLWGWSMRWRYRPQSGSRPAIRTSHDLPDEFCVRTDFALREVTSPDRDDLAG